MAGVFDRLRGEHALLQAEERQLRLFLASLQRGPEELCRWL